jgi:hypothetical protein
MLKFTVVAEANPARICVVGKTSLILRTVTEFAAIAEAGTITVPLREMVNVAAVAAVLAAIISVTIVVVDAGTV